MPDSPNFFMREFSNEELSRLLADKVRELKASKSQVEDLNVKLQDTISRLEETQQELNLQKEQLQEQVRIKTQELLKAEKLTVIGEFSARISHDLRNPLSVISNICDIITHQYSKTDPKLATYVGKIKKSTKRIHNQINDILDFVRTVPLDKKTNSLKEIITRSVSESQIPKNIAINIPDNDHSIMCDGEKMQTVFANIIINSIQAMDEKGVISIEIIPHEKSVSVKFTDSGPGIPEDVLPKIFEPLFTTKPTGTGLGLSSCKNIVESHGGAISVRNDPTVFVVEIPKN
ncbi:MAG: HAMP domain-containing histidine kinase [Thaumarchaeota archaeon]|nr:HAMP domain-containing histidine kinase [Nitrososphaerota archaeon]